MSSVLAPIRKGIRRYGQVVVDLETRGAPELDDAGTPIPGKFKKATDVYTCEITHLAAATKNHAVAIQWDTRAAELIQDIAANPNATLIVHNAPFDLLVLHYRGVIDIRQMKCRVVDTLVLSKVLDGERRAGLKYLVKRFLGHQMVTFEEARETNPTARKLSEVEQRISLIWAFLEVTLPKKLRKAHRKAMKEAREQVKTLHFRERGGPEKRKAELARLQVDIDAKFGEPRYKALHAQAMEMIRELDAEAAVLRRKCEVIFRDYARADATWTLKLFRRLRKEIRAEMGDDGLLWSEKIESDVRMRSLHMSVEGSYIDRGILDGLIEEARPLVDEMLDQAHAVAKEAFNPGSPKQVARILYDVLCLEVPEDAIRPNKDGKVNERPTDRSTLERIQHPIGYAILNWRAVTKQLQFMEKIKANIGADGRVRTIYNSVGAKTLRWSSSRPLNLQNIPSRGKPKEYDERIRELGLRIRNAFTVPEGHTQVTADLSQIELRQIAVWCNERAMTKVFTKSIRHRGMTFYTGDIHAETQASILVDGEPIPRKTAKNVNFGFAYGSGPRTFARTVRLLDPQDPTKFDLVMATDLRTQWFEKYEDIKDTLRRLGTYIQFYGLRSVPLVSGRMRYFHRIRRDEDGKIKLAPGKVLNAVIQGSSADLLKIHLFMIGRHVIDDPEFKGRVWLVRQVHDEIGLECEKAIALKVAERVKVIMEYAWIESAVPILADVRISDSWGDAHHDETPAVGCMYAKTASGKVRIYDESTWHQFAAKDKAGKFVEKAAATTLPPERLAPHLDVLEAYDDHLPLFRPSRDLFPPIEYDLDAA